MFLSHRNSLFLNVNFRLPFNLTMNTYVVIFFSLIKIFLGKFSGLKFCLEEYNIFRILTLIAKLPLQRVVLIKLRIMEIQHSTSNANISIAKLASFFQ